MINYTLSMQNLSSKEGHLLWLIGEALRGQLHLNQETALGLYFLAATLQSAFGMDAEGLVIACETNVEHYEPVATQLEDLAALIREAISYPPECRHELRLRLGEFLDQPRNGQDLWHEVLA